MSQRTEQRISVRQQFATLTVTDSLRCQCGNCQSWVDIVTIDDMYRYAWGHQQGCCDVGSMLRVDVKRRPADAYAFDAGYVAGWSAPGLGGHVVLYDRRAGALWLGDVFVADEQYAVALHTLCEEQKSAQFWAFRRASDAKEFGRDLAKQHQADLSPAEHLLRLEA